MIVMLRGIIIEACVTVCGRERELSYDGDDDETLL